MTFDESCGYLEADVATSWWVTSCYCGKFPSFETPLLGTSHALSSFPPTTMSSRSTSARCTVRLLPGRPVYLKFLLPLRVGEEALMVVRPHQVCCDYRLQMVYTDKRTFDNPLVGPGIELVELSEAERRSIVSDLCYFFFLR